MQELCERLQRAGVDARLTMSGVEIHVPRRPLLLRWGLLLLAFAGIVMPTVIFFGQGVFGPMAAVLAVLMGMAFLSLPIGALMVVVGAFAAFVQIAGPVRKAVAQPVLLTPHALKVRGQTLPLEEISALRVRKWLDVRTLEAQHQGHWVRVSRSEVGGREAVISRLIDERRRARAEELRAEGHDLRAAARPPEALAALRETQVRE